MATSSTVESPKQMISLYLAAALAAAAPVRSEPTRAPQYAGVALSPAGDRVASVESAEAIEASSIAPAPRPGMPSPRASLKPSHAAVVVRSTRDGAVQARLDPCPTCTYAGPAWSPDGLSLAFVASDAAKATATLEVATGSKVRAAASLSGIAQTARWSPDGASLAVLATAGARKQAGATQAGVPLVGELGGQPDEQRIAVVNAAGGALRFVSPEDAYVYEYDWTPDSRGFVGTAAKGDGDANWWVAKLIAVDASGAGARDIAAPKTQINAPRVSPDGRTVVFIGGLMSDFGPVGGDVYAAPVAGGEPRNLTPGFKGSFNGLVWRNGRLLASALVGARTVVFEVDLQGRAAPRELWSVATSAQAADGRFSFSRDGAIAAASEQDFESAQRIVVHADGRATTLTHDGEAVAPVVSAHSVSWRNDGFDIQGWLLSPRQLQPGRKYPMIVLVHGGPSAASSPGFVSSGVVRRLVENGYFVFEPNPRGSHGQGQAFTRANVRDFGGGDLKDILAGVDAVEKSYPVDDQRLGVYGHSYGGFMTMWTVTHSQRFKAAVAGAGIANWISYYGQNGINAWMLPFFGASAYDDPQLYMKLSPISSIKSARTPTFIYVGERDVECPPAQSIEMWNGLRAMNVPTSLVIYEGEGHAIRQPEHQRDLAAREIGWFDRYLKAAPPAAD